MKHQHRSLFGAAALAALALTASGAQAATWSATSAATSSCSAANLFATWTYGSYGFNNDVWSPCGGAWNVYRGTNGSNMVFSFLRTSKTNNTTVDVLAILNYLKDLSWIGNATVGDLQYGFEITSSSGGMNFASKNFAVTVQ